MKFHITSYKGFKLVGIFPDKPYFEGDVWLVEAPMLLITDRSNVVGLLQISVACFDVSLY